MASDLPPVPRFPWGYLAAALLPAGLIAAAVVLPVAAGPGDGMGLALACSLLSGPVGAVVSGWGAVRLWRGDGERFPALRQLAWVPGLVGAVGFALS